MTRMPRVRIAKLVCTLAVFLAIGIPSPAMHVVARQDGVPAPVEVGAGPIRESSLGLTGRNVYGPDSVEMFGYLTSVIGLDPALLFTDDVPSERTARFTYAAIVQPSTRTNRGDITEIAGDGEMQIYLDDVAGASWDDPASFLTLVMPLRLEPV